MNSGLISACFNLVGNIPDDSDLLQIWFNGELIKSELIFSILRFFIYVMTENLPSFNFNKTWEVSCHEVQLTPYPLPFAVPKTCSPSTQHIIFHSLKVKWEEQRNLNCYNYMSYSPCWEADWLTLIKNSPIIVRNWINYHVHKSPLW